MNIYLTINILNVQLSKIVSTTAFKVKKKEAKMTIFFSFLLLKCDNLMQHDSKMYILGGYLTVAGRDMTFERVTQEAAGKLLQT